MRKCKNCPSSSWGMRDSLSDICDGCREDPDTGWGGFTDHSLGKHLTHMKNEKNICEITTRMRTNNADN